MKVSLTRSSHRTFEPNVQNSLFAFSLNCWKYRGNVHTEEERLRSTGIKEFIWLSVIVKRSVFAFESSNRDRVNASARVRIIVTLMQLESNRLRSIGRHANQLLITECGCSYDRTKYLDSNILVENHRLINQR